MGTVTVDPGQNVPPDDLVALRREMADKPGNWRVFSMQPDTGTYTLFTNIDGDPDRWLGYRVQLNSEPLFDMNNEDEIASQGKRFGDGQIVARIPMHLIYSNETKEIGKAFDQEDRAYARKVLNDGDFRKFRSFRGKL